MRFGNNTRCPCCSGEPYGRCCKPLHQHGDAESALAVMRSRYSAFAVGDVDYLLRTLHPSHPDALRKPEELVYSLREACRTLRYMGLSVHDAREEADVAYVLFFASVFRKGADGSFFELSTFRKHEGRWCYEGGDLLLWAKKPPQAEPWTIERFRNDRA